MVRFLDFIGQLDLTSRRIEVACFGMDKIIGMFENVLSKYLVPFSRQN